MRAPCGIHDVDVMMGQVHNWKDVMTYFDKFGLTFFFTAIILVLIGVGVRDQLQRRKRRRQRAERTMFIVKDRGSIREA